MVLETTSVLSQSALSLIEQDSCPAKVHKLCVQTIIHKLCK